MKKIQFIIILLLISSCSSTKNIKRISFDDDLEDSHIKEVIKNTTLESTTTDFYDIITLLDTKKSYSLSDKKSFDIRIINYGQKDLFLPEWLSKKELKIELYRKKSKKFKAYEQKNLISIKHINSSITNERVINSSKKGQLICFKGIELDRYLPIVDDGTYYAIITIDLSNFGYFKSIVKQTDVFVITN